MSKIITLCDKCTQSRRYCYKCIYNPLCIVAFAEDMFEYDKSKITKKIRYEINVGTGCANGTIFVKSDATDDEIRLAILDDIYDISWEEIV